MGEKTGPKPKELKEFIKEGIEIGRGDNKACIPPEEVVQLASYGLKNHEIADFYGVDQATLYYNFKNHLTKGRLELNISLRRKQIEVALAGNVTMLIWLGKNMLGQTDNPLTSSEAEPLPWTDD